MKQFEDTNFVLRGDILLLFFAMLLCFFTYVVFDFFNAVEILQVQKVLSLIIAACVVLQD